MNSVIKKYYQLIKEDEEYLKKYVLRFKKPYPPTYIKDTNFYIEKYSFEFYKKFPYIKDIKLYTEKYFIWRMIKDFNTLKKVVNSKYAMELLRFGDYYSEEMCKLLEEYIGIDFYEADEDEFEKILSKDNLQELLKKDDVSERLKKCINIKWEYEKISRDMYVYIKENCKNTDYNIFEEYEQLECE